MEDAARDRMVGGASSGGVVVSLAVSNEQKQRTMCGDVSGLMTIGDGLFGRQINGVGEDCDEQQHQQAAVRKTVE